MQKNILGVLLLFIGLPAFTQSHYEVSRLDFNTRSKELAPAFYKNGLVFCSDRRTDFLISYTDYNNNPLTNLYFAEHHRQGRFGNPVLLSKDLTTFMFEGPSVFNAEGNVIYFTRSLDVSSGNRNRTRSDTTYGIFMARLVNGQWTQPSAFQYNSAAYNTGYPCISEDGTRLFFCSDKPGGLGGFDIYVSSLRGGTWSEPENLGPDVNTAKNEVFPFILKDGRLYFSSRGMNQNGDLDIYHTIRQNGSWQKPLSAGEPFNTNNDDYGLIFNSTQDTAYFVSDRNGSADIFAAYSAIPSFTGCPEQKTNDYCFVFYESNNTEIDTTAFAYEWDLGDGTLVRALEAEHCFAKPDTYYVQLNIIDKLTRDIMISQSTYTFVVESIEQPYITAPDTVYAGTEFRLNGNETYLKNFKISEYYWDLGDGSRKQGAETRYTYSFPGTYSIVLGITGQDSQETSGQHCVSRKIVVLNSKNPL